MAIDVIVYTAFALLHQVHGVQSMCGVPKAVQNGRLSGVSETIRKEYEDESKVLYVCDSGYRVKPVPISTCSRGQWSDVQCIKMCTIPIRNGTLFMQDYTEVTAGTKVVNGTRLQKICRTGYENKDNKGQLVCDKGTVHGDEACTPARCILMPQQSASYSPSARRISNDRKVNHGTEITKRCKSNYEFSPETLRDRVDYKLTCEYGYIKGCFPQCVPKRCKIPREREATGRRPYTSGDLVNHRETVLKIFRDTEELYFPNDRTYAETFSSTCKYGRWSRPTFPVYRNRRCKVPRRDNTDFTINGRTVSSDTKVEDGTVLEKRCSTEYELTTARSSVCNKGTLVGDNACTARRCELLLYKSTYTDDQGNFLTGKIAHGTNITQVCDDNHEFEKDHLRNQTSHNTTCSFGKIDLEICVEKMCTIPIRNGTLFMQDNKEVTTGTKVGNGTNLQKICHTGYENRKNKDQLVCDNGFIHGDEACTPARCILIPQEFASYSHSEGRISEDRKVNHGTEITKRCKSNYEFSPETLRDRVDYKLTCEYGYIKGCFPQCVPKRCKIPGGREATGRRPYTSGDLVNHGETVLKIFRNTEELYFPNDRTYAETFSSICKYGRWSRPTFPVYRNRRCKVPKRDNTDFTINGRTVSSDTKVEDGTVLEKRCSTNYELTTARSSVCNKGILVGDNACTARRCELLLYKSTYTDDQGNVLTGKIAHGTKITQVCDDNHEFEKDNLRNQTSHNITCSFGKIDLEICVEKMCTIPIRNGTLFMQDNKEVTAGTKVGNGTNLQKICHTGYEKRDSKDQLVCDNGTLHGDEACTPARCILMPQESASYSPSEGRISEDRKVNHGTEITKRCKSTYEFSPETLRDRVDYKLTCEYGYIKGCFPQCVPKRCKIPGGKEATGRRPYTSGDLVNHGETVLKVFRKTEELYFPNDRTYAESFSSTCTYGRWSKPTFPVYRNRRCTVPRRDNTYFAINGRTVSSNTKVEDGTVLEKRCSTDYELTTARSSVCNKGILVGDNACTARRCELLLYKSTYTDDQGNVLTGKIAHGTKITQVCDDNHEFEKDNLRNQTSHNTTCSFGKIDLEICVEKRCKMPEGRNATGHQFYKDGDIVKNNETVYKLCDRMDELYFPDNRTYAKSDMFSSNCTYGNWSLPKFPVCRNKRCEIPERNYTRFMKDKVEVKPESKVENGTVLDKVCDRGYENRNNDSRVECDKGTLYNNESCTPKGCDIPERNYTRFMEGNEEVKAGTKVDNGTVLTKVCNEGFENRNDTDRVECDKGTLYNSEPCFPKRCKVPKRKGTRFMRDKKEVTVGTKVENGTRLEKVCKEGFEIRDKDDQVICDKGKLHGDDACTPKRCRVPKYDGSKFMKGKTEVRPGKLIEHKTVLQKECDEGYEDSQDNKTVVCDKGELKGADPCTLKTTTTTMSTTTRKESEEEDSREKKDDNNNNNDGGGEGGGGDGGFFDFLCGLSAGGLAFLGSVGTTALSTFAGGIGVFGGLIPIIPFGFDNDNKNEADYDDYESPEENDDKEGGCTIPKQQHTMYILGFEKLNPAATVKDGTYLVKTCENKYTLQSDKNFAVCRKGVLHWSDQCLPAHPDVKPTVDVPVIPVSENCTVPDIIGTTFVQGFKIIPHWAEVRDGTVFLKVCENGYTNTRRDGVVICDQGILHGDVHCFAVSDDDKDVPGHDDVDAAGCTIPVRKDTLFVHNFTELVPGTPVKNATILAKVCQAGYEANNTIAVCFNGRLIGDGSCTQKLNDDVVDYKVYDYDGNLKDELVDYKDYDYDGNLKDEVVDYYKDYDYDGNLNDDVVDYKVYDYDGNWTDSGEADYDIQSCSPPEHGRLQNESPVLYKVFCEEGFTLNSLGNDPRYNCIGGQLVSLGYKRTPKCVEDSCVLSVDLLTIMEASDSPNRKGAVFFADGYDFKPNSTIFFNCKMRNYEPVHRRFMCQKGNWIAADRDPTWIMFINSTNPSCKNDSKKDEDGDYNPDGNRTTCHPPEHGRLQHFPPVFYKVICEEGFTLNDPGHYPLFECKEGRLFSVYYKTMPQCVEDPCILTTEMLRMMKIYKRQKSKSPRLFSDGYEFKPRAKLFFNCKKRNYEPAHRQFVCQKGNWIAADRDPTWNMFINSTNPSCRAAECSPDCVNDGTCYKDNKCSCPEETMGRYCEKRRKFKWKTGFSPE